LDKYYYQYISAISAHKHRNFVGCTFHKVP